MHEITDVSQESEHVPHPGCALPTFQQSYRCRAATYMRVSACIEGKSDVTQARAPARKCAAQNTGKITSRPGCKAANSRNTSGRTTGRTVHEQIHDCDMPSENPTHACVQKTQQQIGYQPICGPSQA